MKLVKKILLATDFTRGANDAARMLMQLVPRLDAELVLMHVLPKKRIFADLSDELRKSAVQHLETLKGRFANEGISAVSIEVVSGVDHEEIVGFAEAGEVSLVVVGGGGLDEHGRPRLGSTAERVVRHCRKPVWVVRPGRPSDFHRILCPVDMSGHSARALRNAVLLAERTGASLRVLHVVRPLSSYVPRGTSLVDQGMEDEHLDKRRRAFTKFLRGFEFGNVHWSQSLRLGNPDEVIVERARSDRIDLIVMGSLGRTGVPRLVLGSVAANVTRAFPCAVLTLKDVDAFLAGLQPELDDIWNCYERGQRMLKSARYEDARDQFEVCISLNRLFARAWDGLATAHEKLGDADAAADCRAAAASIYEEIGERQLKDD